MQKKKVPDMLPNKRLKELREYRGWTQEDLAEQIGSSPKAVSRWESGMLPSLHYRGKLCEVFGKSPQELGFIREETDDGGKQATSFSRVLSPQLIDSTPPEAKSESNLTSHDTVPQIPLLWPPTLPDEPYYPLSGREQDLHRLLAILQSGQVPSVIIIDGLGGLGKTSLAVELARRAMHQKLFEGIIGDSAQQELFTGGEIIQMREASLDFERLLNALARQLGRWELLTLNSEEKRMHFARLLQQHRYLVLVDNLETAENAAALVAHLRGMLGISKAIITSRQQVRHDFVQALTLKELNMEDALYFLRTDLQQRGDHPLMHVSEEKLVDMYRVTGGAPLAMKLVVAQAKFLDLELVLKQLRQASGNLYTYIFRRSWAQLAAPAQRVLIYIGRTVMTTVSWEELTNVGIAEDEEQLLAAIDQLVAYSLLDLATIGGQQRYGIHQLTRQFVNGDLPKLWREKGLL
jgi:transcriptional regulator with XRE-family HTH domain